MASQPHRRPVASVASAALCLALLASAGAAPAAGADGGSAAGIELPAAEPAPAAPFVIELRSLAERSDNVFRTAGAGVSDTRTAVGLVADISRDGRMLDYGLHADIDWEHFVDGSYRDSAVGIVDLTANWGTRVDPLQWTLRDTFTQSRIDPVANVTPDNLENVNFLSTGPTLNLPLGGFGSLRVQGLYSKASYEDSSLGSDGLLASVGIERRISPGSSLGAYAVSSRTRFEEAAAARDFDLREFLVRYEAEGRRTLVSADVGYAELEAQDGSSRSNPLLRASVQRRAAGSTLYARAEQRFASSAELAQGLGGGSSGGPGFGAPLSAAGALQSRALAFGLQRERPRTSLGIEAGWREEGYQSDRSLDRSLVSVQARVTRRLRPTTSLTLSLGLEVEDSTNRVDGKAQYRSLSAELEHRVGARLRLLLGVDSRRRTGDAVTSRYAESSVGLRVVYALAERGMRSDRWSLARL